MSSENPAPSRWLVGRPGECATLDGLLRGARAGRSAVLVIRGEPGIGKSALLDYLADAAADCHVLRVAGVESQMELAFAGLHQLCDSLLDKVESLPAPQANALHAAFGLRPGDPPDRVLIGLAALSLLAEGARERPLVCLVDDAQWLDHASVQTLTFVARRLEAESVVLVFVARTGMAEDGWTGLPQLSVHGLPERAAEGLLDSAIPNQLDNRVRNRILAETHGNPLALLELPRLFSTTELALGPAGSARSLTSRMEEGFRRQLELLPEECRRLLLMAAAEPLGDVTLLWRAAERIGVGMDAAIPAQAAGLLEVRDSVRFRHPLVRAVVYRCTTESERQAAHRVLAQVTDPAQDPDRHAWHRAHAANRPDEDIAEELERSAGRALAQGGLAATAAFLERAAMLTPDAAVRAERRLNAVQAMLHLGTLDAALDLLAMTEHQSLTSLQRTRVSLLRAQIEFASNRGREALPKLVIAARQLEPLDIELALDSYLDALTATLFAGRLASAGIAANVAQAARRAPLPPQPRRGDTLLQAVAVLFADGYPSAVPLLRKAVQAFDTDDLSLEEGVRFMWLAAVVASDLWDERAWDRLTGRHLQIVRSAGALSALPLALNTRVYVDLYAGDLVEASALVEEITAVNDAAETTLSPYAAIGLAAFRGHVDQAAPLIATAKRDVIARGEGIGVALTHWADAMLCNGLGHYVEALEAARIAAACPEEIGVSNWGLVELVEAAVRAGERPTAAEAFERLQALTQSTATNWAMGVAARSGALLLDGTAAEQQYREAIARLERTSVRVELARARLLYGEWLRRRGRRRDAREQLRAAHTSMTSMGLDAFAARARRELAATGETVRKRREDTRHELTAQEVHIARLAIEGLTYPEIGAELFISPRTVEWHMQKIFAKTGITSRRELRHVVPLVRSSP